jgi:hypothetical protein
MLFGAERREARATIEAMMAARRRGHGVYLREWRYEDAEPAAETAIDSLIAWCRATHGRTRRPWGIAEFDLALAVSPSQGARPRSLRLSRLTPSDLYPGDALRAQLRRFLEAEQAAAAHLAVALFSWGDAAHAALPQP